MNADLYQQAKAIFSELLEATPEQRDRKLDELQSLSPDLEREVRSLLDYHTAQSLISPQSTPKIRTRSTLSTTYHTRSWKWLEGPRRGLMVALPLFLISLALALWIENQIRQNLKRERAQHLSEAIDYRLSEFRLWEKQELQRAGEWAKHPGVVGPIERLVESIRQLSPEDPQVREMLTQAECCGELSGQLAKLAGQPVRFSVWDRRMLTVVDWNQTEAPTVLGQSINSGGAELLTAALQGDAQLLLPHASMPIFEDSIAATDTDSASVKGTLSIVVPVMNSKSGAVIAALLLRGYGLDERFASMLSRWSTESSGEVYLLNNRGALISESRFAAKLDELPLAYDKTGARQFPLVRDPGAQLLSGQLPAESPAAWMPTLMARQVTSGNNGVYVDGYRNYVGQQVVGAWRWLPDHKVGIALEESYQQAYAVAGLTRNALLGISTLFTLGLVGFSVAVAFAERGRTLRSISEVGPYQIQELLGEGGMGRVYLAEHALLCRQSAIKVLTKGDNDLSVISRFEREVQLASQLTHPNTISIYDFGRSREGIFYYAMEYINGGHLGQLVEYAGPIDPGRCIHLLKQLCRALLEAHQAGVVHRDIKPQNIMVCNRGGEPDFVKLFDYGLVKAFAPGVSQNHSQTKVVVGTPRFMAPERLSSPWLADPRVDVYSVGALAYYLLTALLPPLVTSQDEMENEQPGVETLDLPPAVVDFGGILSVCMSVEPASRPSSMSSLMRELESLAKKFPWSREDSEQWWSKHEDKFLKLVRNKRKHLKPQSDKIWREK